MVREGATVAGRKRNHRVMVRIEVARVMAAGSLGRLSTSNATPAATTNNTQIAA